MSDSPASRLLAQNPKTMMLQLDQLEDDPACQSRCGLDEDTIECYVEAMTSEDQPEFPPIEVYFDGERYWPWDGYHRIEATRRARRTVILARVRPGTRREAIYSAMGANATHGLRRTNADKWRAVKTLLDDIEWSRMSDRAIAKQCRVCPPFVAKVRKGRQGQDEADPAEFRQGSDGKLYPISTTTKDDACSCTQVETFTPDAPDVADRDPGGPGPQLETSPTGASEQVDAPPVGQCRVNGVLVDDPPDIAEKRRQGTIPAGVVPVVTIHDAGEAGDEAPTPEPEETFEEWFATLPLAEQLDGDCLQIFAKDVQLYYLMREPRKQYQARYQEAKKEAARGRRGVKVGEYEYRTGAWLKHNDPSHWLLCPRTEEGGCGGLGELPHSGECKKCRGRGYLMFDRR
jgi:hypothetical protein